MKDKKNNYIIIGIITFIILIILIISCFFISFIYKGNNIPLLWSLIPLHAFIIFGEIVLYSLVVITKRNKNKSVIVFYILLAISLLLLASLLIVESMVLSS